MATTIGKDDAKKGDNSAVFTHTVTGDDLVLAFNGKLFYKCKVCKTFNKKKECDCNK